MLGRFLELVVPTPRPLDSLNFYCQLGFGVAADTGSEAATHVTVGDGRISIGFKEHGLSEPALVFVRPGFSNHLEELEQAGLLIDHIAVGDHAFNRLQGHLPGGLAIQLIEARTHSPLSQQPSKLGWFDEIGLPIAKPEITFWQSLGFVALEMHHSPWARLAMTSDTLTVGLHAVDSPLRPWLTFECDDVGAVREMVSRLGLTEERHWGPWIDRSTHLVLIAPEGTPIVVAPGS
jgi:hypothetical protein